MFPIFQSLQKGVRDYFILFRSWVICEIEKRPGFYILRETRFLSFSLITQVQDKIEKIPIVDIVK